MVKRLNLLFLTDKIFWKIGNLQTWIDKRMKDESGDKEFELKTTYFNIMINYILSQNFKL